MEAISGQRASCHNLTRSWYDWTIVKDAVASDLHHHNHIQGPMLYTDIYLPVCWSVQRLINCLYQMSQLMALFVLRKLILQTRMCRHPVGLDAWFLVGPFVYFDTLCVRTAKALARLRGCAGSPEPSLVAYAISTIISWAGSNVVRANSHRCLNGTGKRTSISIFDYNRNQYLPMVSINCCNKSIRDCIWISIVP